MRKTLMLSESGHARINALAEQHAVSQPEVIDALLESADADSLGEALLRAVTRRRVERTEILRRRKLLQQLAGNVSSEDLERLLQSLSVCSPSDDQTSSKELV